MHEMDGGGSTERESDEASQREPTWRNYFGFDEPYPNQADAIETAIETALDRGFLAMEGPCGTGKTMASLTAAAYLLRETTAFDNVLIVTPVKQQLTQFVEDLRSLNRTIEEPLSGVALVGKGDLCPYDREDKFPSDIGVNERCDDLRDSTASLVQTEDSQHQPLHEQADTDHLVELPAAEIIDDRWWDPHRAHLLTTAARPRTADEDEVLSTAGASSPYRPTQPSAPSELVDGDESPLYCPFEADWYARDRGSSVGFEAGIDNVITSEEFLPAATERGTCPHRVMSVLLEHADVLIGNYNHLFDPRTRHLTERVLDDDTFIIVDEAHRLEGRVRDLLSDRIGRHSLRRARGDLRVLQRWIEQDSHRQDIVGARFAEYDVSPRSIAQTERFYDALLEWFHHRIDRFFAEEFSGSNATYPDRDLEIPLRDPAGSGPDELREWAIEQGFAGEFWERLGRVGAAVADVLTDVDDDRTCLCGPVGALLEQWWTRDHSTYFREITLEYSPNDRTRRGRPWEQQFRPALYMYNCIPSTELRRIFSDIGGGILMSATLEPISVFKEVVGLDELYESDERPVEERSYHLHFPSENRASWIVDSPAFTQRNRGDPLVDNRNDTRETYAYILRTIARSPGNILLCLPNYAEAKWAAERLRADISKPVYLDTSSSDETTTQLRREFFDDEYSVLVTSTRGTLTEGIDYEGDKLHTCAVVGIPLVNIGSPRVTAVCHAYGNRFGDEKAFEYALTVPAVRRSRQALGRVIRGPDEVGIRILVGQRYTPDAPFGSVFDQFPEALQQEFVQMKPMFLETKFNRFWDERSPTT